MSNQQNTEEKKHSVYNVMWSILNFLNSPQEQKSRSGYLAAIRNSMGKNLEDSADVWPILFPFIPKEFLNVGTLSYEERALLVALLVVSRFGHFRSVLQSRHKAVHQLLLFRNRHIELLAQPRQRRHLLEHEV